MILPSILVFFAAVAVAAVLTPAVIFLARRYRLVDPRSPRKVHAVPVPRVGGVAIVMSMILVSMVAMLLDDYLGQVFQRIGRKSLLVLFAAGGFVFLVGVLDDVRGLPAKWKLLAQVIAAAGVCAFGIRIGGVPQLGWQDWPVWLDWPVTILWIVIITNAVNLIDGLAVDHDPAVAERTFGAAGHLLAQEPVLETDSVVGVELHGEEVPELHEIFAVPS